MCAGFRSFAIDTSENTIHGVTAGDGPAVLLLHGIPQTHLLWRFVAPILAKDFTVVAADLRGYGDSGCTVHKDPRHHSMRELAAEQAELMELLGHERFAVVGHDRGARCAYRLALDFPDVVTAVSVMDAVPTADAFAQADARFALDYWLWSFLAAPAPVPETLIAGAPGAVVDHLLDVWSGPGYTLEPEVRSAYHRKFHDPERVATIRHQYRAAATIDREHDSMDRREGRKIRAPLQVLWSRNGAVHAWYDPIKVRRQWAVSMDRASLRLRSLSPRRTTRRDQSGPTHILGEFTYPTEVLRSIRWPVPQTRRNGRLPGYRTDDRRRNVRRGPGASRVPLRRREP